jgi:hypothetical protein
VPIDRLTGAQEARLAELSAEWEAVGLATGPADRARAERAIRSAYLAADLPPPSLCIWVRSPLEGVLGTAHLAGGGPDHLAGALQATYLDLIGHPGGELWSQVWAPFTPPESDALGEFLARMYRSDPRAVTSLVDGWVWSDSHRRLRAQISGGLAAQVRLEVGAPVRLDLPDDEPLVCVEVTDARPDAAGTFSYHMLRVPPDVRTPREAVAWTFGVEAGEYHPLLET